ncbi:hypothetical protein FraQA3DRAFT_1224 [Frankia sp. QA3]|nr:hypothetical protein FraQA3DRAFT_1224 [Frankia sp. QA3]
MSVCRLRVIWIFFEANAVRNAQTAKGNEETRRSVSARNSRRLRSW